MTTPGQQRFPIGARVRTRDGDGIVTALSVWETDMGDRHVLLGDGTTLVYEAYLMAPVPMTWSRVKGRNGTSICRVEAGALVAAMCELGTWELISTVERDGVKTVTVDNGSDYVEITRVPEGTTMESAATVTRIGPRKSC